MYLKKNRTIQDKSTKYRKIQENSLIFPKLRKYRKHRTCGSPAIYMTEPLIFTKS